ncbi:MAG TPA: glycosyltransferase family 4 protein [Actinomycetota bacterium]|jgi:glycosyltransferase involved in cell wall biosynthesis|nr:glycosyltransferase family 4 protein [Actinomycetota bacterium]
MNLKRGRRILAIAYAYAPEVGSEGGVGWLWVRALARHADVWVLTAAPERVRMAISPLPEAERIHVTSVQLPRRLSVALRRGWPSRLHYLVWQRAALATARRLVAEHDIDLVWHLTHASVGFGSIGALLGRPFVLGPVGGGVGLPWRLAPALGLRGALAAAARGLLRVFLRFANPLSRVTWRRARLILVQNPETIRWLPRRHRERARMVPNAILRDGMEPITETAPPDGPMAMFTGRLLPWRGVALAIRAVAAAPGWRLVLCGRGPDERRLRMLARRYGVADRVRFLGWRRHPEILRLLATADVFLFPSLRDDAPVSVAEAVGMGLPVLCVDRGGPPILAGSAAAAVSHRGGARRVAARLAERLRDRSYPGRDDAKERGHLFALPHRMGEIEALLRSVDHHGWVLR